jgi:hypothetical protein
MPDELRGLLERYIRLGALLRRPSEDDCDRDALAMVLSEMDRTAKEMHVRFGMPDFSRDRADDDAGCRGQCRDRAAKL